MKKKLSRFSPNFIIKHCHNYKCNRTELHSIIIKREITTNLFVIVIKCLSCNTESRFQHNKGG